MEVDLPHPNPHPQPLHYRKVELQSPLDLTYLQANLQQAALAKLNLHFPPTAYHAPAQPATFIPLDGAAPTSDTSQPAAPTTHSQPPSSQDAQPDPLRSHVSSLISTFLTRTLASAAQNITINGLDAHTHPSLNTSASPSASTSDPTQDTPGEREGIHYNYTPYDARLQHRVAHLYGEVERLTAEVSALRRTAPKAAAERVETEMEGVLKEEDGRWEAERKKASFNEEWKGLEMEGLRVGWWEDVKGGYERATEELGRLVGVEAQDTEAAQRIRRGGSLTETVGRVQRARAVAMEFD